MTLEIGWHEVREKLGNVLTKEDYESIGHLMDVMTHPCFKLDLNLMCNKCGAWAGSEYSMNPCKAGPMRVGGYLDFKSEAIARLKERVGTIGIPIRERRVI
jgi:hypothetical protein